MGNKGLKKVRLWNPDGPNVRSPNREAPDELRPRGFWCENSDGALGPVESVKDTQLWGSQLPPLPAKEEQPPQPPAALRLLRAITLPPSWFRLPLRSGGHSLQGDEGGEESWTPPNSSTSLCHHRIHQQLNPAFPSDRSPFILRCKPEIRPQECLAAKLVG